MITNIYFSLPIFRKFVFSSKLLASQIFEYFSQLNLLKTERKQIWRFWKARHFEHMKDRFIDVMNQLKVLLFVKVFKSNFIGWESIRIIQLKHFYVVAVRNRKEAKDKKDSTSDKFVEIKRKTIHFFLSKANHIPDFLNLLSKILLILFTFHKM